MTIHQITPQIVADHGLKEEEYQKILSLLGREPNFTELGIFSAMWSEHCSYKSSKIHLRKLPTQGKQILQGPGENAGVVDIGDGLAVAFKMESHNHPSFIEPYQGAATGVGGILRDVFTMGARPIANLNSLRFGEANDPKTRFLVNGVVGGISGYGNCVGVPTVAGEVYFDACYNQNILVNAMTVGLIRPGEKLLKGIAAGVGNPVIYVGSKTGRDGIHGATMSSSEFDDSTEEKRPTVQVGDPFTEKLLLEACLELMKKDYLVGIQDMGAAGLTSSSFEMAARAGTGIDLNLDEVPTREQKMTAYELMLSESQERMLLVVQKGFEEEAKKIFEKWDLDAAVVGLVTDSKRVRITHHGEIVADLPIDPLVNQAPIYEREMKEPEYISKLNQLDLTPVIPVKTGISRVHLGDSCLHRDDNSFNSILQTLLSSPNLSSRRWVWEQYDHMVMTNTVVLPGSDAAVLRIKGTNKGIAVKVDCNSRYCYLNPRQGAKIAVAEAARNVVCAGGKPLAITNCLNFGNPEKPEVMWQFKEAVEGISEACLALGTPVTGGNVSFYNETKATPEDSGGAVNSKSLRSQTAAIYPTPTIGMVGVLDDISYQTTQFFKQAGDLIFLVGETFDELGGSEYLKLIHQRVEGPIPKIDLEKEKLTQNFVMQAIRKGFVKSAHDLSEGGLAVAVAECCMSGSKIFGAEISLSLPFCADAILFGESQSRVILSVDRKHKEKILDLAKALNSPIEQLGEVTENPFLIVRPWINLSVSLLQKKWDESFSKEMNQN